MKGVYRAPIGGHYNVRCEVTKYKPTGRFEMQENWSRKWFQFWKPKMVLREVMERVTEYSGSKTIFVQKDDVINPELIIGRVSN